MINKYPLWKYILILVIIVPGLLYALPNLYGDDPGLQVRGARQRVAPKTAQRRAQRHGDARRRERESGDVRACGHRALEVGAHC